MSGIHYISGLQQLIAVKDEVLPEQQERGSSLKQEDSLGPAHIKEEQEELGISQEREQIQRLGEVDMKMLLSPVSVKTEEDEVEPQSLQLHQIKIEQMETGAVEENCKEEQEELGISQEREQLQGAEEADTNMFMLTLVPVKSDEEDGETPQSSQLVNQSEENRDLEHLKKESDGEDCGSSGVDRDFNTDGHLQLDSCCRTLDLSWSDTDEDADLEKSISSKVGLNAPSVRQKKKMREVNRSSEKEKAFRCSSCCKTFSTEGYLKRHSLVHAKKKQFNCSVCKKQFLYRRPLEDHMRVHTGEKPFSCLVCHKRFSQQGGVTSHMTVHTGEKPFKCSVCHRGFSNRDHLKNHMTIHTEEKPFSCSVCHEKFSRRSGLKKHMFIHRGENPFSCSVCHKRFSHGSSLKRHMVVHKVEKPFSCSVCHKQFSKQWDLKSHMTIHTGEKPFSCSVCNKSFRIKHVLVSHMAVHSDQKPFRCSICNKDFRLNKTLVEHMRVHTGVSRSTCSLRGKRLSKKARRK